MSDKATLGNELETQLPVAAREGTAFFTRKHASASLPPNSNRLGGEGREPETKASAWWKEGVEVAFINGWWR
jgi:hypothetical protein